MFKTKMVQVDPWGETFHGAFKGFDKLFDEFSNFEVEKVTKSKYPPLNMYKSDEKGNGDEVTIEVAVAGFDKSELEVFEEEGFLYVKGEKEEKNKIDEDRYIVKTLSTKRFEKKIQIKDYDVDTVKYNNGILKIVLKKKEEKTKKVIEIL